MQKQMTSEELVAHIDKMIEEFKGDAPELIAAIGTLMVGRVYGWKVLRIITSSKSYSKYQRVLGMEFKDYLPATTKFSDRSLGFKIVTNLNNFWEVVQGKASATINPKDKRTFSDSDNVLV